MTLRKKKLTPEQKEILINKGTELPFTGKFLHNKESGEYKCVQCGNILFSSKDKFESGTGWPSFKNAKNIELKKDESHGMARIEVICKKCGGHLGHFFEDGPYEKRYCINSLCLDFKKVKK